MVGQHRQLFEHHIHPFPITKLHTVCRSLRFAVLWQGDTGKANTFVSRQEVQSLRVYVNDHDLLGTTNTLGLNSRTPRCCVLVLGDIFIFLGHFPHRHKRRRSQLKLRYTRKSMRLRTDYNACPIIQPTTQKK